MGELAEAGSPWGAAVCSLNVETSADSKMAAIREDPEVWTSCFPDYQLRESQRGVLEHLYKGKGGLPNVPADWVWHIFDFTSSRATFGEGITGFPRRSYKVL